MPDPGALVVSWLRTGPWAGLALAFLLENLLIFALCVGLGGWAVKRFAARRVAPEPDPLTRGEVALALFNVALNTATTLAGLWLWRRGVIALRTDVSWRAWLDVPILVLVMDAAMYALHRIAHTRLLFPLLHERHHRYERPRPLTLFLLSPVENLAFGLLWLAVLAVHPFSWLGISIYLALNVASGTIGHLGVEPFPKSWARLPLLRHLAGGTFHAQHHLDVGHNFGFYTLLWDRLFGSLHPTYTARYGSRLDGDVR